MQAAAASSCRAMTIRSPYRFSFGGADSRPNIISRLELYRRSLSELLALKEKQPPTDSGARLPCHSSTQKTASQFLDTQLIWRSRNVAISGSHWRCPRSVRGFATKRKRLDEYDSYEATIDPRKVPPDFCRVPIHFQSAGELKDTVTMAGRMRLTNPNFWMRCSSALKDHSGAFRARELVAILNAYAKANYRDVYLFNCFSQLVALQAHDCRASDLAVALQAFARLNIHNRPFFDLLALQCIRKMEELGPRGIATAAAAYGGVQHHHPLLFSRLCEHTKAQIETFCNTDLIQVLWACSRVSYRHLEMLNRCADQLISRLATCTVAETLSAAQAFASLGFYRADLVGSFSSFLKSKICSIPVRSLPLLLEAFTSFDRLARAHSAEHGKSVSAHQAGTADSLSDNADLYRTALPAIARAAICFSFSELASVDSALHSVGLRHDLLTRALQQVLQQQGPYLTPGECVDILVQVASRGGTGNNVAAAVAIRALLSSPEKVCSLPDASILQIFRSLKKLQCSDSLAVLAWITFGDSGPGCKRCHLRGAELLVAQRILLQYFSAEAFVNSYCKGRFLGASWKADADGTSQAPVASFSPPSGQSDALQKEAVDLYASILGYAKTAAADALVLALCRYSADPGVGLWLELLMEGRLKTADPELLPALLVELARLQKEREAAEEAGNSTTFEPWNSSDVYPGSHFPPIPSSDQLSQCFCQVACLLMESPLAEVAGDAEHQLPLSGQPEEAQKVVLYRRLSVAAAGSAAKAVRSHPQPEIARRYARKLSDMVCLRLAEDSFPGEAVDTAGSCRAHHFRQEAKCLARLLQTFVTLGANVPSELLRELAPRLKFMEGKDILSVLRLISQQPAECAFRHHLACAVDLRFRDLKSWRQLNELRELCVALKLAVDDDIAEQEADVSRYQSAEDPEEEYIPTLADAMCELQEDAS